MSYYHSVSGNYQCLTKVPRYLKNNNLMVALEETSEEVYMSPLTSESNVVVDVVIIHIKRADGGLRGSPESIKNEP